MSKPIEISTNLAAAIATWASADADHKCGAIYFGGDRIMATDGHRLVIVPHPTHGHTFGIVRAHLLAAVAAQNALARDGIDPPLPHDLSLLHDGDMGLADGPCGHRTIEISPDGPQIKVDIGAAVVLAPMPDIRQFPVKAVEATTKQPNHKVGPDGYMIDPRFLSAITEINNATAGYRRGVRVTGWSRLDKEGKRGPVVLEGQTGVRFAIMPVVDEGEPS